MKKSTEKGTGLPAVNTTDVNPDVDDDGDDDGYHRVTNCLKILLSLHQICFTNFLLQLVRFKLRVRRSKSFRCWWTMIAVGIFANKKWNKNNSHILRKQVQNKHETGLKQKNYLRKNVTNNSGIFLTTTNFRETQEVLPKWTGLFRGTFYLFFY